MGSGIATALILSNYPVILKEVNEKFLQAGIDRVKGKAGNPFTHTNIYFCYVTSDECTLSRRHIIERRRKENEKSCFLLYIEFYNPLNQLLICNFSSHTNVLSYVLVGRTIINEE